MRTENAGASRSQGHLDGGGRPPPGRCLSRRDKPLHQRDLKEDEIPSLGPENARTPRS